MSRTYRRNDSQAIRGWLGTVADVDDRDRRNHPLLTDAEIYKLRLCWYRSDNHSGRWNANREWRRTHYTVPGRRRACRELHRCIRNNEWDDHLTLEVRGARSWYWWIHT